MLFSRGCLYLRAPGFETISWVESVLFECPHSFNNYSMSHLKAINSICEQYEEKASGRYGTKLAGRLLFALSRDVQGALEKAQHTNSRREVRKWKTSLSPIALGRIVPTECLTRLLPFAHLFETAGASPGTRAGLCRVAEELSRYCEPHTRRPWHCAHDAGSGLLSPRRTTGAHREAGGPRAARAPGICQSARVVSGRP